MLCGLLFLLPKHRCERKRCTSYLKFGNKSLDFSNYMSERCYFCCNDALTRQKNLDAVVLFHSSVDFSNPTSDRQILTKEPAVISIVPILHCETTLARNRSISADVHSTSPAPKGRAACRGRCYWDFSMVSRKIPGWSTRVFAWDRIPRLCLCFW